MNDVKVWKYWMRLEKVRFLDVEYFFVNEMFSIVMYIFVDLISVFEVFGFVFEVLFFVWVFGGVDKNVSELILI